MGTVITVTSCKGGVGKTTVTANLSSVLASMGHGVVAVDCDFGMRCLDLVMGAEDLATFDFGDALNGTKEITEVVIRAFSEPTLGFVAAPYEFEGVPDRERFASAVKTLAEEFDFVLLDTPGDRGEMLRLAASVSDTALILATHQPASIRAAERTAGEISACSKAKMKLIINNFDASAVSRGAAPGIIDIIDRTSVMLVGVIPLDGRIGELQERGELMGGADGDKKSPLYGTNIRTAFGNIAKRLCGRQVPLLSGFSKIKRKQFVI